jgi:hypothetical protein
VVVAPAVLLVLPLLALMVVPALVVVVPALVVVVVLPGVVVELAGSVVVTGRVVVVVTPAATALCGAPPFGTTISRTIVVTTPSATTAIARRLISEGSKSQMLEATRREPYRHGYRVALAADWRGDAT